MTKPIRHPESNPLNSALNQLNEQAIMLEQRTSSGYKHYKGISNSLRVLAQQQHNNRFIWLNLPEGIDSLLMERMLWFRYQVALYYDDILEEFHILPFTLSSDKEDNLDYYNRYNWITPTPFNGKSLDQKNSKRNRKNNYLEKITKKVVHDIPFVGNFEEAMEMAKESAVIINDYSSSTAQYATPMAILQQSFVEAQTESLKLTRRSLLNSTPMKWVRFKTEADAENFNDIQDAYNNQILESDKQFVGFSADLDFQESGSTNPADVTSFWAAYEALDNLRLKTLGISSDGAVQKRAQMLQSELALDNISSQHPLLDSWMQRIQACAIINAIWDLGITCELNIGGMEGSGEQENSDNDGIDMGDNPGGENETN